MFGELIGQKLSILAGELIDEKSTYSTVEEIRKGIVLTDHN
jgi:hypothetical protein